LETDLTYTSQFDHEADLKMIGFYLSRYFPEPVFPLSSDEFSQAWYDQNLGQGQFDQRNPNQVKVTYPMRSLSSHPGIPVLDQRNTNAVPGETQSLKVQICPCHGVTTLFEITTLLRIQFCTVHHWSWSPGCTGKKD